MNNHLRDGKISKSRNVFTLVLLTSIVFTVFELVINSESTFQTVFFSNYNAFFSDFFDSIYDSLSKDPYTEKGIIYPAFICIFYRFMGSFIPINISQAGSYAIRDSYIGQMLFHGYCFTVMALLFAIVLKIMKAKDFSTKVFALVLLLSSPVLYAYERGNSILLSLLFLLVFFCYKDSEKAYQREIAFVCLAISANIKLYPAVFGLILLTEKKYKQALRCAFYGVFLFVIPFFFYGNLKTILVMFSNIFNTNKEFSSQCGYQVGIKHLLSCIAAITGNTEIVNFSKVLIILAAVLLSFSFLFSRNYFKKILALGIMCCLIPTFSWLYATIYILPAILYFYNDVTKTKYNAIYPICFILLFCQFPFDISNLMSLIEKNGVFAINYTIPFQSVGKSNVFSLSYGMTLATWASNIALWVLLIVLFVESISDLIKTVKHRKNKVISSS